MEKIIYLSIYLLIYRDISLYIYLYIYNFAVQQKIKRCKSTILQFKMKKNYQFEREIYISEAVRRRGKFHWKVGLNLSQGGVGEGGDKI